MTDQPTTNELASYIDHTILSPTATADDIVRVTEEALELGVYAIYVSPSMLRYVPEHPGLKIATVCGFPSGKHLPSIKAAEAATAVGDGADEVDMVIDISNAIAGKYDLVEAEIAGVRASIPSPTVLKVIMESAALTTDQIENVTKAAIRANADFVKTSTGFHPAGGASLDDVQAMARASQGRIKIKASGGIRTFPDALAYLDAGADRLGLSSSRAVVYGVQNQR